ncbi:MAG: tetratricopeptide repeat protein [Planctomycetaceae bacterium]
MPHTSKENEPTQRRVLNLKALAILGAGGTLLWLGMNYLHASQVVRTSAYLKQTAEQALVEEDHTRAFDMYEQYLVLNPNDDAVEEQISKLLEEHGTSAKALQRAFQINERLLRDDRDRDDLRIRQIRIADKLGRYSDAAVHLKTLREKRSDLSEVWHFSGIVARDTGEYTNAIDYFQTAIHLQDVVPESYEYLAQLLTSESKDPVAAESLLQTLINTQDSAKSRRIRASWLLDQNQAERAIPDLWQALKSEPHDVRTNAMMLKAIRTAKQANRDFDDQQHYNQVIAHLQPEIRGNENEARLRLYLSSAMWAVNQRDAAIQTLEEGIERDPRQFEMHEVLVDYLVSEQRYDRAQDIFDRIPGRVVDRGRREFMRGRLLMSQKHWKEAINAFELALGFARQDPNMASRARVCLALCRRENGDDLEAMDTMRELVQSNPEFEGGRLGMASAYLRTDQVDLAIAEYRQLLHVEGVPEFLANLMIRHNLTLPRQSRNWAEVRDLLRDKEPLIRDPVQRSLLQADLLFGEGFPAQAMDLLDEAARQMPDRPEIQRAYQRLSAVHGDELLERIRKVLDEDGTNAEAHTSILKLLTAREDLSSLDNWLADLLAGRCCANVSEQQRLHVLARSSMSVAEAEELTRGSSEASQLLLKYADEAWRQLAGSTSQFVFDYVHFLAVHQSVGAAMEIVDGTARLLPDVAAQCWLECLRQAPRDTAVKSRVNNELVQLIRNDPSNVNLRLAYADSQILTGRYGEAETLLQQLASFDPGNGRALGRLAWLAALIQNNPSRALQLSEQAARLSPSDPSVRSIRGLALAQQNQTELALEVLTSIPATERSMASYLYEARTLLTAGRHAEAVELVRDLIDRPSHGRLAPAEEEMLRQLQQQLQIERPKMTQR